MRVPARTAMCAALAPASMPSSGRALAPAVAPLRALSRGSRARAMPPPTSARSLALQRLYAEHRPLLEHEQLPMRPARLMSGDVLLIDAEEAQVPRPSAWRRRARPVDAATFSALLDDLSRVSLSTRGRATRRTQPRGFAPTSPAVHAASRRIAHMERDADMKEQAVANALEHGEDVERAARLGAEAELVVLGEPDGAHKDWAPGVATHLGTETQPYVPPQARRALRKKVRARTVDDYEAADEDAHLWLTQGLVHTRVRAEHDWQKVWRDVSLDSVRRKRKKKMNKHKYKKLRKRQRAERRRLKK